MTNASDGNANGELEKKRSKIPRVSSERLVDILSFVLNILPVIIELLQKLKKGDCSGENSKDDSTVGKQSGQNGDSYQ